MTPTEVVHRWIEAFNACDVDAAMKLYADDASLHVVFADAIDGKAGIRDIFEAYFAAGDLHCDAVKLHAADDWIILEWRDANGLPGANIYQVVDGRIVRQRNYFDQLTYLRKMGIPLPTE